VVAVAAQLAHQAGPDVREHLSTSRSERYLGECRLAAVEWAERCNDSTPRSMCARQTLRDHVLPSAQRAVTRYSAGRSQSSKMQTAVDIDSFQSRQLKVSTASR
jgi:hypothetical protein